ncbi:hypothetical protein M1146_00165 [Patescibacteria group bacterium]|nr:hypothetical protein [Patescibacteria group bacterium]
MAPTKKNNNQSDKKRKSLEEEDEKNEMYELLATIMEAALLKQLQDTIRGFFYFFIELICLEREKQLEQERKTEVRKVKEKGRKRKHVLLGRGQ